MSVSRIYRLLKLITTLQAGRALTANELAEELAVSRRTIFRDLKMLELAGIPYYFDADRKGYQIREDFFLPPVNFTLPEAMSVMLLASLARDSRDLPLLAHGQRAAVKLESSLPPAIRHELGSLLEKFSVSLSPAARHEGMDSMFDDLAAAVNRRRVCELVYISFHDRRQVTLKVHPLRLAFVGRAWYLIAYSTEHGEPRTFKLGRIRSLRVLKETFHRPRGLELGNYFGAAWNMIPEGQLHDVHLRFSPMVAGNVAEVRWHDSQQVQWKDDGSMEFRARVDGLGEITWWILGYGDHVEVLEPPQLRQRVAQVAASVLQKYRQEGSA